MFFDNLCETSPHKLQLPTSDYTPHPGTRVPTFVKFTAGDGVEYWVVTAWFVDPGESLKKTTNV
jgi:hypothetical protein